MRAHFHDHGRAEPRYVRAQVSFADMNLSTSVLHGLTNAGFEQPSSIHLQAIPLGRFGADLIAQAKSGARGLSQIALARRGVLGSSPGLVAGTGTTCVFAVIALEVVQLELVSPQVVVLAPTREIANQICAVIATIRTHCPGLKCESFIGGTPVGSPGRVWGLIEAGALETARIKMLVLDEADKLLQLYRGPSSPRSPTFRGRCQSGSRRWRSQQPTPSCSGRRWRAGCASRT
jgi:ATP-dependent RNA helicase DDX20